MSPLTIFTVFALIVLYALGWHDRQACEAAIERRNSATDRLLRIKTQHDAKSVSLPLQRNPKK